MRIQQSIITLAAQHRERQQAQVNAVYAVLKWLGIVGISAAWWYIAFAAMGLI